VGHVLAGRTRVGDAAEFETDREHFIGRGGTPRAPAALTRTAPLSGATGAVLDPIISLRTRLRVPPGVTARVSFATVLAEHEEGVRALIEKYHDPQVCSRAFALASTHSEIELRHLGVSRDDGARFERLAGRVIHADPRLRSPEAALRSTGTPPDLWKYGISGDLPIVLVTVADATHVVVAQELVRAQEYLRARGFRFDLVVLNEIPTSYRQDVQDDLQRMAEASPSQAWLDRPGGLFLRRADLLDEPDRVLLRAVARAIFDGARSTVISENLSFGQTVPSRKGPPLAVSQSLRTEAAGFPSRHWKMAECSLSTASTRTPFLRASFITISPAMTRISFDATAMSLPARMAASAGCNPAVPTMAMSTMSAAGSVASSTKPSAPE
jgi:cyclic beta-1,2-glucan synthetase